MAGLAVLKSGLLRRVGWGLSDQAFSSITNFALGALVARSVSAADFGAFSLAFATYTLLLSLSRAITSEPLVMRKSAVTIAEWSRAVAGAGGASLSFGLLTGVACIAVGAMVDGTLGAALIPLGFALPGLLLQDCWRSAFFARRKGQWAFVNDLVWGLLMSLFIGALLATDNATVSSLVLAWGGAATGAALLGLAQARVLPRPALTREWWREQRDLIPPLLGEIGTLTGARQLTVYGIGAIAGLTAVGSIRGGLLLLGPLNVLFMGIRIMSVPEAVRALKQSHEKLQRGVGLLFRGLVAVTIGWAVVLLLLPREVGVSILGETWEPARRLIVPLALADAAHGGQFAGMIGLRALTAADRSFRAKAIASVMQVVLGLSGAVLAGAAGAAWGRAIAQLFGVWIFFREFGFAVDQYRSQREPSATPPVDAQLAPAVGLSKE